MIQGNFSTLGPPMSAVPYRQAPSGASAQATAESAAKLGSAFRARPLFAAVTIFWAYVTMSNVTYAHAMQYYLTATKMVHVFASWDARVVQHLILYPILVGCVWLSLRIRWRPAWRTWPLQILLGLLFATLANPALDLGQYLVSHEGMGKDHSFAEYLRGSELALWLSSIASFLLTYGFCIALATGISLYQRFHDAQLRMAELERAWGTARLATLRMQLSPHTLFNLLHTIRGQVVWDPAKAQAMIVQLGDLLRRLLKAGDSEFVRLAEELQFVQSYLDLQKQRFSDRLTLELPDASSAPAVWVPSLILQPIVENAIAHGLAGHEGPVLITIEIAFQNNLLTIRVANTVGGVQPSDHEGVGLRNVRERLAVQFGNRAGLEAGPANEGQWLAVLRIPALLDGPAAPPASATAPLQRAI
jgi:hypothetical protein